MRFVLLLFFMCLASQAFAQLPPAATQAKTEMEARIEAARSAYVEAEKKAREEYVATLKALLKSEPKFSRALSAELANLIVDAPKPALAKDEHEGLAGAAKYTRDNVYTLKAVAPQKLSETKLIVTAHAPDHKDNSNGIIEASLDGINWVVVGKWTPEILRAMAANSDQLPLFFLPGRVETDALQVRFRFSSGGLHLIVQSVEWQAK